MLNGLSNCYLVSLPKSRLNKRSIQPGRKSAFGGRRYNQHAHAFAHAMGSSHTGANEAKTSIWPEM
jgi:hypothetical protein